MFPVSVLFRLVDTAAGPEPCWPGWRRPRGLDAGWRLAAGIEYMMDTKRLVHDPAYDWAASPVRNLPSPSGLSVASPCSSAPSNWTVLHNRT